MSRLTPREPRLPGRHAFFGEFPDRLRGLGQVRQPHASQHVRRFGELDVVVADDLEPVAPGIAEIQERPGDRLDARHGQRCADSFLVVDHKTEVTAIIMNTGVTGHKYAIQCVTDSPHWGGLSGCTFEEAQSWGKIAKDASMVTCHSDSTIAMPFLVSALLEHSELVAKRHRPSFKQGRELEVKA